MISAHCYVWMDVHGFFSSLSAEVLPCTGDTVSLLAILGLDFLRLRLLKKAVAVYDEPGSMFSFQIHNRRRIG